MKLQKQLSRKIGEMEYPKWVITIPPELIKQLGWEEGQELKASVITEGLLVMHDESLSYDAFKAKVMELLRNEKNGMTWQEIKQKLGLPQAVPNNKWVSALEKEIGLKRRKDGSVIYWYLSGNNDIVVYTIGYEGKSLDGFIKILKENGIQQLIDVRELAASRKNGFAKSALSKLLRENGIIYKHFPVLGSPREIRYRLYQNRNYKEFFEDYAKWLSEPESQEYLTDLEGLAHVRRTAIMCFEKDVNYCHRSIIKNRLLKDGFKVIDI